MPEIVPSTREDRLAALLRAFLQRRSAATLRAYRNDIASFGSHIGTVTPGATAREFFSYDRTTANAAVLSYRAGMEEQGLSPATINRRLSTLRSFVKMARISGLVDWDIEVEGVKNRRVTDTAGPGKSVVQEMLRLTQDNPRDHAILRLLYDLGLRRAEIAGLRCKDVSPGGLMVTGKGHEAGTLLDLPEVTRCAIDAWLAVRVLDGDSLFGISAAAIYRLVKRLSVMAGRPTTPHGIRHTAITEACKAVAKRGMPLEAVRAFSRHVDIRTVMAYRDNEEGIQGKIAEFVAAGAF